MKYEHKLEFDCAECGQKFKIYYNSKEVVTFCPFCGEEITKIEHDEELIDDDVEDDFDSEEIEW